MKKKKKPLKYTLISIASVVGFLLLWWLATDVFHWASPQTLPSPVTVLKTFVTKLTDPRPDNGTMFEHIGASLQVALSGYLMGVVIGTPLGILMAWYKPVDLLSLIHI